MNENDFQPDEFFNYFVDDFEDGEFEEIEFEDSDGGKQTMFIPFFKVNGQNKSFRKLTLRHDFDEIASFFTPGKWEGCFYSFFSAILSNKFEGIEIVDEFSHDYTWTVVISFSQPIEPFKKFFIAFYGRDSGWDDNDELSSCEIVVPYTRSVIGYAPVVATIQSQQS